MAIFSTIIGITYLWVQLRLRKSWKALAEWHIPEDHIPSTTVLVVIPARNEAANIRKCLDAILNQDYPEGAC